MHTSVTGAPARYVNTSFTEVAPGSLFVADKPAEQGRLVRIIRRGRTDAVKCELIGGLAAARSDVTASRWTGSRCSSRRCPVAT